MLTSSVGAVLFTCVIQDIHVSGFVSVVQQWVWYNSNSHPDNSDGSISDNKVDKPFWLPCIEVWQFGSLQKVVGA